MQVAPSGGQICNWCKFGHLVAKYATNASGAMLFLNSIQVIESISGSVVPLAMFIKLNKYFLNIIWNIAGLYDYSWWKEIEFCEIHRVFWEHIERRKVPEIASSRYTFQKLLFSCTLPWISAYYGNRAARKDLKLEFLRCNQWGTPWVLEHITLSWVSDFTKYKLPDMVRLCPFLPSKNNLEKPFGWFSMFAFLSYLQNVKRA